MIERPLNAKLCEAQDLMHNVRAILGLCELAAFHLDELASEGKPACGLLDAIGRAARLANDLTLEAIIMVDEASPEMRRGIA